VTTCNRLRNLCISPPAQVSTSKQLQKGAVIGVSAPLLVHQTLANREEVLVCACCHRFVGTPATQLAMIEGLSRSTASRVTPNSTSVKKRRRCEDAGANISGPLAPADAVPSSSRRAAVARAPRSRLPDLPALHSTRGRRGEAGEAAEAEGKEEGLAVVWTCEGGAPCEDVYCSSECREAARLAGHGLICIGGSEPGR